MNQMKSPEERIERLQARIAELSQVNAVLQRTIARLATNPDLDAYLGYVLLEAAEQVGACSNALFVYDEAANTLMMRAFVNEGAIANIETDPRLKMWRSPIPADITPNWRIMIEQGLFLQELYSHNSLVWQHGVPWHLQMGHTFVIYVPLRLGNCAIGFMGLGFRDRPDIAAEKVTLSQSLADQATLALELTRLAEMAKFEAQQATLLEERNRIARELHDTLAQTFTGVIVQLEAAQEMVGTTIAQKHLTHAGLLARQGLQDARRSIWSLRPEALESGDLHTALLRIAQQMTDHTAIVAEVVVDGTPIVLPEAIASHLLRIGQESLTNALKHAQAQHIQLRLQFTSESIQLEIVDDGQGFDPQSPRHGFGITSMQQRTDQIGGKFTLTSQIGQGTTINVRIPIVQASWRAE